MQDAHQNFRSEGIFWAPETRVIREERKTLMFSGKHKKEPHPTEPRGLGLQSHSGPALCGVEARAALSRGKKGLPHGGAVLFHPGPARGRETALLREARTAQCESHHLHGDTGSQGPSSYPETRLPCVLGFPLKPWTPVPNGLPEASPWTSQHPMDTPQGSPLCASSPDQG